MSIQLGSYVAVFKALADETRLNILVKLSAGEMCGCIILEDMNISQPTLSYHMKILTGCELVNVTKKGAMMLYSLNCEQIRNMGDFWGSFLCIVERDQVKMKTVYDSAKNII